MQEVKIITKLWDKVNPWLIDSYLAHGGYEQFLRCQKGEIKPAEILDLVEESGLRGRGGAGFPTGCKWKLAVETGQKTKKSPFLIVNADESQPGTFKDRTLMEKTPHLLLEGALIAAYALGAKQVYLYVNGKYPEAQKVMKAAIEEAREKILADKPLKGIKGMLEIKMIKGAGGYIFGEETALINSLAAERGEPRIRPPYPPQKGLFGRPTVVNNVETIANVVSLLEMGAKEFRKRGTKLSPGTKLFTVTGAVKKPGVYELELGVKMKDLVKAAGGMEAGKRLALMQVGGGHIFEGKEMEGRLVYEEGTGKVPVGLGDALVVDKETEIEDVILSRARFYERESCGQCTPCREGTYQLLKIAERLKEKRLLERDWENMRGIIEVLEKTSFCAMGGFSAKFWQEIARKHRDKFFKK